MTIFDDQACPVCLSQEFRDLGGPGRGCSLRSDMRTVPEPLGRVACLRCGLVRRRRLPHGEEQRAIYGDDYALFAELPTDHALRRQETMAAWMAEALGGFRPGSVLELGCGDGSLLEALRGHFPGAALRGVEPAPRSVAEARRRGVQVSEGFAEAAAMGSADLCVSVNVIEHVSRPLDFLRAMRDAIADGGRIALVCPDGDVPNYELLFHDHLYSYGRGAIEALCARAGLAVLAAGTAPSALGPFRIAIARIAGEEPSPDVGPCPDAVAEMKEAYLRAWSTLGDVLRTRIGGAERVVVFGNGDVAALLRLYAPAVWALAEACVVDGEPPADRFLDRPLRGYRSLAAPEVIVLGVRPGNHEAVARRLAGDGHRVVRWDDIVAA